MRSHVNATTSAPAGTLLARHSAEATLVLYFLFGLAFTIPLSILANIITPNTRDLLARRSAERLRKRTGEIAQEYRRIKSLHDNQGAYHSFLLTEILRLVGATTILAAAATMLAGLAWLENPTGGILVASSRIPDVILDSLLILLIARIAVGYFRAARIISRVKNFASYESAVKVELEKRNQSLEHASALSNHGDLGA